jgi:hypothetical protein
MVQVREVSAAPSDTEYEDVSDEYTDSEESVAPRQWSWSGWSGLCTRMQGLWKMAGSLAWMFTTSMLLIGLPVLFAYDREKSLSEQQLGGLPPVPAPQ